MRDALVELQRRRCLQAASRGVSLRLAGVRRSEINDVASVNVLTVEPSGCTKDHTKDLQASSLEDSCTLGRCCLVAACPVLATRKSTKQQKIPGGKLVAVGHVGGEQQVVGREQVLFEMHTIRVVFHDFANLPHSREEWTESSALLCHGYQ
jgi:hypothetical protein